MSNQIRVRIAPSPTGPLHIGTARTALFNWLFARKNKGDFILRIEDTDLERSDPKFEEEIKDSLDWLNLEWDEFYKQSERIGVYKKYLQKLLDEGKAFWCYHTIEELEQEKKEQTKRKEAPRHICQHKYMKHETKNMKQGIIRLAVDENSTRIIHFNDIIRGTIEWQERLIGDLSLAKNLETPLYNFAAVVDDYETKISHVIRGEDHISNTPKQILIQEALGFNSFQYVHLPLILGSDRTKLSKRHGAESIQEYMDMGYLPEAMINFMALLGWHQPEDIKRKGEKPEDIFTIDELAAVFNLEDVQKSPAVFDIKKLNWMNSYYIHQLPPEQFRAAVEPFIIKELGVNGVRDEYLDKIQHLMAERMEKLSDVKNFDYFFKEPEYNRGLLIWKTFTNEEIKRSLTLTKEALEPVDWGIFDKDYIRKKIDNLAKENFDGDRGAVYWPLRVALTGKEASPDPIDILAVLPKETVIKRLENAIKLTP
ncbi:MAG: glutamate--tRNA ligase [Patescibacteria group bacterium]